MNNNKKKNHGQHQGLYVVHIPEIQGNTTVNEGTGPGVPKAPKK